MYMSRSLIFIVSLCIHAVYSQTTSKCNFQNLQDCCSTEAKLNARAYIQKDTLGADIQDLLKYYNDLCQFRTLNEQASYIKAQYDKLASVNMKQMFTSTTTTPKTTTTTRRPLVKTTSKPAPVPTKPPRP